MKKILMRQCATDFCDVIAILLSVVGVFAKTLRVLRRRAANSPTINWKIAI